MSAAAMDLLMGNFNSQLQQESGLHLHNRANMNTSSQQQLQANHIQQQQHPNNMYNSYQQAQYGEMENSVTLSPTGSPVRQLKRLHPGATNTATELLRCRRRIEINSSSALPGQYVNYGGYCNVQGARQVSSVARRNERERNRVRLVNHGFALLRQHVPSMAARSKKMSKVDTLKAAVDYIQQLRDVLDDADSCMGDSQSTGSSSPDSSPRKHHAADQENNSANCRLPTNFSHHDDRSVSPASSCPDGSRSPNGYCSSGSEDGTSSSTSGREMTTSGLELHHARALQYQQHQMAQRQQQGCREDEENDLHIEDFASWFC